jgi:phage tail sheath protein FI
MTTTFLHGVEVLELDTGIRPIRTVRSAVIGLIGTAPDADANVFPLNTPVLIAGSRAKAGQLGSDGTLPAAMDGILDQIGATVVVVRVEEGATEMATLSNVVGNSTAYTGVYAWLRAEAELGVTPKILVAPGFTHQRIEDEANPDTFLVNPVVAEMLGIAQDAVGLGERLRAIVIADGPNTSDAAAQAYAADHGSDRLYVVDPWVRVLSGITFVDQPASARVAGLIARVDAEVGFWESPSNKLIQGVSGVARPVPFALGDANSAANLLNEAKIATIIREEGFRLWGNRTTASDSKWQYLSVRRTADMVNESILRGHLWAVDRCITRTYLQDVAESVNEYLRSLKARGAILGGECWIDPEANGPGNIANGTVTFDFDFTPCYPAERVSFRSVLTNGYLTELLTTDN